MLSSILSLIQPSATLSINAKAIELKKQGKNIVSFAAGEPDFDTPDFVKEAAIKALKDGFTKYTDTSGIIELRQAICDKLLRDNKVSYEPNEIIVTAGGKQALYNTFQAILNPGDEVLLPSPYWVSFLEMIHLAGGKAVTIDTTNNNFKVTAAQVRKKITAKTKAIVLNSPSNPTGAIIDRNEVEKIAALAFKHNFFIISDEVYEYFSYGESEQKLAKVSKNEQGEQKLPRINFSPASLSKEVKAKTITINAFSKTYSMTGWRVGYSAAPKDITILMANLQSHATSNPCSIAQKAALAAITGSQDYVINMRNEFKKRRDYLVEAINQIPGFSLHSPAGAFYAFIDVSGHYNDTVKNSFDFSEYLLEKAGVAVVPGGAFGAEGEKYVRMSYATSLENITEGIERLRNLNK